MWVTLFKIIIYFNKLKPKRITTMSGDTNDDTQVGKREKKPVVD